MLVLKPSIKPLMSAMRGTGEKPPPPTQMENEMDYPITPDDEFRANFLEEKLKKSQDLAQSLADALEGLIDDEGKDYIKSSAWDAARAALANYRKEE